MSEDVLVAALKTVRKICPDPLAERGLLMSEDVLVAALKEVIS